MRSTPVALEWMHDPTDFASLAAEWEPLARASDSPFASHAWLSSWWMAFGRGSLAVCLARRDGVLVAGLPLMARGGMLASLTNAHTPLFEPVGDAASVEAVVEEAVLRAPGSLVIQHLPRASPVVEHLCAASRRAGRIAWIEEGPASPIVTTAEGREAFHARLGRKRHKEISRLRRRLVHEFGAAITPLARPDDLERELDAVFGLEASGWKGRRGTAILTDPSTAQFYRNLSAALASRDELRISTIVVGGRTIAFDLGIISHGRAWLLKGSYDESFRRCSPGNVLLLDEVEHAFELGLAAIELLGSSEEYKLRFSNEARAHCTVHSYRRTPPALARVAYRRALRPHLRAVHRRIRRH